MKDASISLRTAEPRDLAAVSALLLTAELPADGLEEQFGPAYVVAVAEGEIIGAEGIERYGDAGLLRSAVVSDRWRGRGIGDLLTKNRLAWAKEQQLREVWLLTTTADGWFPRFGFARADRAAAPGPMQKSREFTDACPSSATAMRLILSPATTP